MRVKANTFVPLLSSLFLQAKIDDGQSITEEEKAKLGNLPAW